MKILEYMSFDLAWFTTVPGMLITGGVVVMLIAFIVLATSGKSKSEEEIGTTQSTEQNLNGYSDVVDPNMQNIQMPVQPEPVQNEVPVQAAQIEIPAVEQPAPQPVAEPKIEIFEPNQNVNTIQEPSSMYNAAPVTPVQPEPVAAPTYNINTEEANQVELPKVEPVVAPAMDFSNINIPKVEDVQPAEPIKEETPSVSIYGGISPTTNLFKQEEPVKPVIYGGADPLENTAPIPQVNINKPMQAEAKVVEQPTTPDLNLQAAVMNNNTNTVPDLSASTPQSTLFQTPVQPEPVVQQPVASANEDDVETLDF